MNLNGKNVLVAGAKRGIGRALVDEALERGAGRVYASTRVHFQHQDPRVGSLSFDVGEENIFPDPMAQQFAEGWRKGVAKGMERQFAAIVPGVPSVA
jgi:NAD(P)-dependent dehydrogenase (short-subunit alcohol dehydrogenase family)